MFVFHRPTTDELVRLAGAAEDKQFTYAAVGATRLPAFPGGYHHLRRSLVLAHGGDVFEKAVAGLRNWTAQSGAGITVEPRGAPIEEGLTVALAGGLGPFCFVALARVVYVVDEEDRFRFAYGTLPGHPESGEEAFAVERDRSDGATTVRIEAFSRPAETLSRLGGPLTRLVQRMATDRYLAALSAAASGLDRNGLAEGGA